jgi:hypothetical protein
VRPVSLKRQQSVRRSHARSTGRASSSRLISRSWAKVSFTAAGPVVFARGLISPPHLSQDEASSSISVFSNISFRQNPCFWSRISGWM